MRVKIITPLVLFAVIMLLQLFQAMDSILFMVYVFIPVLLLYFPVSLLADELGFLFQRWMVLLKVCSYILAGVLFSLAGTAKDWDFLLVDPSLYLDRHGSMFLMFILFGLLYLFIDAIITYWSKRGWFNEEI